MELSVKIEGFKEATRALDKLPDRFQRQTILKMLRRSTRPMIRSARSKLLNYGSSYSNLAKSIGNITAKSKNPIIYVGPRTKGKWKMIGYTAHWVEYGTKGIKKQKGGRIKTEKDKQFAYVGRIKKGSRYRADQPPKPFMRTAIDANRTNVVGLVKQNFNDHLQKVIDKTFARLKK